MKEDEQSYQNSGDYSKPQNLYELFKKGQMFQIFSISPLYKFSVFKIILSCFF